MSKKDQDQKQQKGTQETLGVTVKKEDNMPEWYGQVCLKAELAEYAPVKGCMIIRPRGYYIWESIQKAFDTQIKKIGVQNASFPLFIPETFFEKEKTHAQGFSPEVAWIANKYEGERIAVRPTSETIICDSFQRWIRSHRDLPLRINQWCNVVRWETEATKLFLRTREFLWQEGHCVYATSEECEQEVMLTLNEYERLLKDVLAIPVIKGLKTEKETFAGADHSYTIEAFMPDGKALQSGTSHHLGQGFMKSFNVSFRGEDEQEHTPFSSSWGISTRLIGALVMLHSDNKGLVLPPQVAQDQIVVVPIIIGDAKKNVLDFSKRIVDTINQSYRVVFDDREEHTPGFKFSEWELKGVPLRIEVGPRDVEKNQVVMVRRDTGDKEFVMLDKVEKRVSEILAKMHNDMYAKAKKHLDDSIIRASDWSTFTNIIADGKMALLPHCTSASCEEEVKDKTKGVSSRCIPLDEKEKVEGKKCFHCHEPAKATVIFGRGY